MTIYVEIGSWPITDDLSSHYNAESKELAKILEPGKEINVYAYWPSSRIRLYRRLIGSYIGLAEDTCGVDSRGILEKYADTVLRKRTGGIDGYVTKSHPIGLQHIPNRLERLLGMSSRLCAIAYYKNEEVGQPENKIAQNPPVSRHLLRRQLPTFVK